MSEERFETALLAERIIGCAMREPAMLERLVRAGVSATEFEHQQHGELWNAVLACHEKFGAGDAAIVADHLTRNMGWKPDVAKLWITEATRASWSSIDDETLGAYAERLRHAAAMRRLRKLAERIASLASDDNDASSIAAIVEAEVQAIVAGSAPKRMLSAAELADEYAADIAREEEDVERIPVGLGAIDVAMRGGARRGSTLVVAADTGIGKSTFGAHMLLTVARAGVPALYFTFETQSKRIFSSAVEMQARSRLNRTRRHNVSSLMGAAAQLSDLPLWIDDTESMTVEELSSKIHGAVKRNGVKVVFVDYVQDIERSTKHSRDDLNYAHISKVLRRAAARYNVLIVEFAQLADTREASRHKGYSGPTEADIAYTRQFAKDASYIVILDRLKLSDDPMLRNLTRARLVKNRPESTLTTGWMRYDEATNSLSPADERGRDAAAVELPDDDPFMS